MSPPIAEHEPLPGKAVAHAAAPADGKSRPVLGATFMLTAAFLFGCMNALVKYGADLGMDPLQIAFVRSIFGTIAMLPMLILPIRAHGWSYMRPVRPWLMAFRGASSSVGVMFWMTAVALLPLAEVTAISFTAPLIAALGSALILGEKVRARRWTALLIGFCGVLVILRPGMVPLEDGFLIALCSAGFMALASLLIKTLTRTEPADRIVFWTNIGLTIGCAVPASLHWVPLTPEMWGIAVAMGVAGAVSHVFLTRSFAVAEMSVVLPFDYARLPFIAVIGYMAFGEVSDAFTWIGAGIIAASAIYIAHRERQVARAADGRG